MGLLNSASMHVNRTLLTCIETDMYHPMVNRAIPFVRQATTGQWRAELNSHHIQPVKQRYGGPESDLGYEKTFHGSLQSLHNF